MLFYEYFIFCFYKHIYLFIYLSKYTNRLKTQTLYTSKTKIVLQEGKTCSGNCTKSTIGCETKMEFKKEGVLLNFEEYAEYQRALHALAALRNVTSFNTTSKPEEVEA